MLSGILAVFSFVVDSVSKLKEVLLGVFIYKAGKDKARQEGLKENVNRIKKELKVEASINNLSANDILKRLRNDYSRGSSNDNG